jgi:poly(ADP-ribose) polymerase-like protein
MAHKIEPAPTGRATCRGCKQTIAKGELRFGEEFQNSYSEDGGLSYRYWHLACAASKLANELRGPLAAYEGVIDDRPALEALVETHAHPEMPYAERAANGRAKCRVCDESIKKGELRVAFERVFEGPMGPQKGAAYTHPGCVAGYLERERERGREAIDRDTALSQVLANSKLGAEDLELVGRGVAGTAPPVT